MRRIGRYRLLDELARGGFGAVYRAYDDELGREVALKLLLVGEHANANQRRRFQREAQALSKLRHAGIVPVFDVGEADGRPYLVMALVKGRSLQVRLSQEGRLSPGEAAALIAEVAWAVAHAHTRNILHRDIKPANILLDERGRPLLTDFGLARELDPRLSRSALTGAGQFVGTPGYWAPEQARGELDRVGPATDVYGLGATLYAALTGVPPRGGATPTEIMDQLERPPTPPAALAPEVDGQLEAICLGALADAPQARPESAAALAEQLEAYCAQERSQRRWSGAAVTALMLVMAGLVIGAAILTRERPAPAVSWPPPTVGAGPTRSAADREPDQRAEAERLVIASRELLERGEWARGLELCEQALVLDRHLPTAWHNRAAIYRQRGDLDRALEDQLQALELNPSGDQVRYALGMIRFERGELELALEQFARACELAPRTPLFRYWLGYTCKRLGRYDEARQHLEHTLRLDPRTVDALNSLGAIAHDVDGDLPGAIALYSRALELAPGHQVVWGNRMRARRDQGDLEGARADALEGLRLDPGDLSILRPYLGVASALGRWDEGLAIATRLLELDPAGTSDYLYQRGMFHYAAGALEEAERDLSASLDAGPPNAVAHSNRGLIRRRLGRLAEAGADYERALALEPQSGEAWLNRASLRLELGDHSGARDDVTQALRLLPPGAPARAQAEALARQLGG